MEDIPLVNTPNQPSTPGSSSARKSQTLFNSDLTMLPNSQDYSSSDLEGNLSGSRDRVNKNYKSKNRLYSSSTFWSKTYFMYRLRKCCCLKNNSKNFKYAPIHDIEQFETNNQYENTMNSNEENSLSCCCCFSCCSQFFKHLRCV